MHALACTSQQQQAVLRPRLRPLLPLVTVGLFPLAPPSLSRQSKASMSDTHHIDKVRSQGWTVLPALIPREQIADIRTSILQTTLQGPTPKDARGVGKYSNLLRSDGASSLAPFMACREVIGVVEGLLGAPVKITFTTSQTNHADNARGVWHADWPYNNQNAGHGAYVT